MPAFRDLKGERFGRLTVRRHAEEKTGKQHRWWVQCDCGAPEKTVLGSHLTLGRVQSCGCLSRDRLRSSNTTHGLTHRGRHAPEYAIWCAMKARCSNPNRIGWKDYGGRGIRVCDRWSGPDGFANFLADMGPRPSKAHTLDRKNNDGPYDPDNCRWATRREQARNFRRNVRLTYKGETLTLVEWGERLQVSADAIGARLSRGWSPERALTEPVKAQRRT